MDLTDLPSDPQEAYVCLQQMVEGENINVQSLLATDYLNHFNEVHMMMGMLADMPECLEDVLDWSPKSYQDHFRDSGFHAKDLAIQAYEYSPKEYLEPFEQTVSSMDTLILGTIEDVSKAIEADDMALLAQLISQYNPQMEQFIEDCSGIINATKKTAHQEDIDHFFEDEMDGDGLDQSAIDDLFG